MRVAVAIAQGVEDYGRVCMAMFDVDEPLFYVGTTATRGDALGARYARENSLVIELCFAPRGDRQERNRRMLEHADVAVVVGTDADIEDFAAQAAERGLPLLRG